MSDRCKKYGMMSVNLTQEDIKRILASHNNIRNLIALDRRIGTSNELNYA